MLQLQIMLHLRLNKQSHQTGAALLSKPLFGQLLHTHSENNMLVMRCCPSGIILGGLSSVNHEYQTRRPCAAPAAVAITTKSH